MTSAFRILSVGFLLAIASPSLAAEAPIWSAKIEVLMVAMPTTTALEFAPQFRDEASSEGAFQKLQRAIDRNKVEVLGWPVTVALSGKRGVSETVEEVRYPSDDDLSWRGDFFSLRSPKNMLLFATNGLPFSGFLLINSFETRNTGQNLEVEPVVDEQGERITIPLVVQDIRLVKMHYWSGVKDALGISGVIPQPEFAVTKFVSILTARSGKWTLVSHSIEKQENRTILFLLRATAIRGTNQQPSR